MNKLTQEEIERYSDEWSRRWEGVVAVQNHALNWIFTINGGGLAGTLAYAAARSPNDQLIAAVVLFSAGLLFLVGYAGVMYYFEARLASVFRESLKSLYRHKVTKEEHDATLAKLPNHSKLAEVLAWLGSLSGGTAIALTVWAIL